MSIKFQPLEPNLRSDLVFNTLKDAIFSGQLKPGEQLKEMHLASDFKVSQSTIREALIQLEQFGLVEKIAHKGTRVIDKSEKEIRERIVVRFKLEELAGLLAAPNMDKKDWAKLKSIEKKIVSAAKKNQYFELVKNDLEFHMYIWNKSGNQTLEKLLEQVTVPLFAAMSIQRSRQEQVLEQVVSSHARLVEALESKDKTKIKQAYRDDLKESYGIRDTE